MIGVSVGTDLFKPAMMAPKYEGDIRDIKVEINGSYYNPSFYAHEIP